MLNKSRRYIFPIVIVALAAAVSWWSSRLDSRVSTHVMDEVTKLVPKFHKSPSIITEVVVDPILEPLVAKSLQLVYDNSITSDSDYSVVVTSGDNEDYGDGTATHVAVFKINKKPIAGLRVICLSNTDPVLIAGVFPGNTEDVNTK
ncbi:MAG: hypothetical protein QF718_07890 [Phycisphaerales bacterium]|nr:hypothetical protein [Phycisphaerales bacterium]